MSLFYDSKELVVVLEEFKLKLQRIKKCLSLQGSTWAFLKDISILFSEKCFELFNLHPLRLLSTKLQSIIKPFDD